MTELEFMTKYYIPSREHAIQALWHIPDSIARYEAAAKLAQTINPRTGQFYQVNPMVDAVGIGFISSMRFWSFVIALDGSGKGYEFIPDMNGGYWPPPGKDGPHAIKVITNPDPADFPNIDGPAPVVDVTSVVGPPELWGAPPQPYFDETTGLQVFLPGPGASSDPTLNGGEVTQDGVIYMKRENQSMMGLLRIDFLKKA